MILARVNFDKLWARCIYQLMTELNPLKRIALVPREPLTLLFVIGSSPLLHIDRRILKYLVKSIFASV